MALRGDVPSGAGLSRTVRHAEDLVRLIRDRIEAPLAIEVGAYPEVHPDAATANADLHFLKRKVDAGADGCITQYFYNAEAFFHFRDRCTASGIDVPIVPGVMPITNYANLVKFSDKAGVDIPRWIRWRLDELEGDDNALRTFGCEVVTTAVPDTCRRRRAGHSLLHHEQRRADRRDRPQPRAVGDRRAEAYRARRATPLGARSGATAGNRRTSGDAPFPQGTMATDLTMARGSVCCSRSRVWATAMEFLRADPGSGIALLDLWMGSRGA